MNWLSRVMLAGGLAAALLLGADAVIEAKPWQDLAAGEWERSGGEEAEGA